MDGNIGMLWLYVVFIFWREVCETGRNTDVPGKSESDIAGSVDKKDAFCYVIFLFSHRLSIMSSVFSLKRFSPSNGGPSLCDLESFERPAEHLLCGEDHGFLLESHG